MHQYDTPVSFEACPRAERARCRHEAFVFEALTLLLDTVLRPVMYGGGAHHFFTEGAENRLILSLGHMDETRVLCSKAQRRDTLHSFRNHIVATKHSCS